MKHIKLAVLIIAVTIFAFSADGICGKNGLEQPPNVDASTQFRFVGVTSQNYSGMDGWLTLTRACNSEFPGGKMANTAEFFNTVNPPDIAARAWILPTPPITNFQPPGTTNIDSVDGAGVRYPSSYYPFFCNSFGGSGDGLQVETNGLLNFGGGCGQLLPVACSVPY